MKYRVTITHSPQDNGVAAAVGQALEGAGLKCTYSSAGMPDIQETVKAIAKSQAMVLVLSKAVNGSPRINKEVQGAADAGNAIITFRIDKSPLSKPLEFYLSNTHWLDASSQPIEKHLAELVLTVCQIIALRRPRSAWKSKAAMALGIMSIVLAPVLGFAAIFFSVMEFRGIKTGRSMSSGRKYAWIGILSGAMGSTIWAILMFRWWYWDLHPSQYLIDWLNGVN